MRVPTPNNPWRLRAWRCLAWLGCAVLLFGQGLPNPAAPPPLPLCAADPEAEAQPVPASDDDDPDAEAVPAPSSTRCQRVVRRNVMAVLRYNRLAHLPHHQSDVSGFRLPVCTPFERGSARLPLRC